MNWMRLSACCLLAGCTTTTLQADEACVTKPHDAVARLSWNAPNQYVNDDPLPAENISHYTVHHVTPNGEERVYLATDHTSLEVPISAPGKHYFTVRAHTKDGRSSGPSVRVCKEI